MYLKIRISDDLAIAINLRVLFAWAVLVSAFSGSIYYDSTPSMWLSFVAWIALLYSVFNRTMYILVFVFTLKNEEGFDPSTIDKVRKLVSDTFALLFEIGTRLIATLTIYLLALVGGYTIFAVTGIVIEVILSIVYLVVAMQLRKRF